ncbi:hypothetical protein CVT26_010600 [Gymnopilus dilepis]|uniref:Uncharacterized protein n=1 Tax=Gymnopilus dilepis TaxID=231916 RepID=A0A409VZF9_9AGAR|nr:hypothetical protein CVT26_010600 [Gymnopilus dilepis]
MCESALRRNVDERHQPLITRLCSTLHTQHSAPSFQIKPFAAPPAFSQPAEAPLPVPPSPAPPGPPPSRHSSKTISNIGTIPAPDTQQASIPSKYALSTSSEARE